MLRDLKKNVGNWGGGMIVDIDSPPLLAQDEANLYPQSAEGFRRCLYGPEICEVLIFLLSIHFSSFILILIQNF